MWIHEAEEEVGLIEEEEMDQTTQVVGLNPQTNVVFTVVKPVMGIFQVSPSGSTLGLQQNTVMLSSPPPSGQTQSGLTSQSVQMQVQPGQVSLESQESRPNRELTANLSGENSGAAECQVEHLPFAEVSSLLDPNMKGSKARKYLISYDEIRRRLQPPEKMSLRSIAAYTRVSRGPASKKTLLESLNVLGLAPSTTTSVSSSFSKLTEGDTRALCEDMKDFAHDYIDYENMAKQLIPKINTVQHWSKIIETKNHLEDMRKCFQDTSNSQAFDNVTHGLGLGMLDVVLDMISSVIQHQIRILSGAAASDTADSAPTTRRIRRRHRKLNETTVKESVMGVKEQGRAITKAKGRGRKKTKQDAGNGKSQMDLSKVETMERDVLRVLVGYEAVSNELNTDGNVMGQRTEPELTQN